MPKLRGPTNKKEDFLDELMRFSPDELNEYIKANGKPPKSVRLYHMVDKKIQSTYESAKVMHLGMAQAKER